METVEETIHFLETLKKSVVLEVLVAALLADRKRLAAAPVRFAGFWVSLSDRLTERAERDLRSVRMELRRLGVEILETVQSEEAREVRCRWKGTIRKEKWLNEWLKAECVKQLEAYAGFDRA
ncbi:hypothetical protein [Staphylospora marina]|uniref:hypothetical protein n=1 Tax=Staphylospora marina TaxID=2490858 RepID=UPI000F5B8B40|nr:hypothetical protein [Staphylospora marina]